MADWRKHYEELAGFVGSQAAAAAPLLAGFNTCVDQVYRPGPELLDALTAPFASKPPLARRLRDQIVAGRGGEVFDPSDHAQRWLADLLGEPTATQLGGTGAQAAWVLAVLGAPSVLALADRSAQQLAVVHPAVGLVTTAGVRRAGDVTPAGRPTKPPHYILELTAGTRWTGGTIERSDRIIIRFAADGIEHDQAFAAAAPQLAAQAGAGLVSGLNAIPDRDQDSRTWLRRTVTGWRDAGMPNIHLELAEYPRPTVLADVIAQHAVQAGSLGMNLAELHSVLGGVVHDPAAGALQVAQKYQQARVFVHADHWSLVVHRSDPQPAATAVRLGNLLAAARAAHGRPTNRLTPAPTATFTADHPVSRELGAGWRVECAPTPYLPQPAATIGLGDAFVAGALLADCLGQGYLSRK